MVHTGDTERTASNQSNALLACLPLFRRGLSRHRWTSDFASPLSRAAALGGGIRGGATRGAGRRWDRLAWRAAREYKRRPGRLETGPAREVGSGKLDL